MTVIPNKASMRWQYSTLPRASNGGRSLAFRHQGKGATPWQYIDTTRKAIDCATTSPLTVFI